jgi:hypothetical protein
MSFAGVEHLEAICSGLNEEDRPWNQELRRLLNAWKQSGPNLKLMFEADPALREDLESRYFAQRIYPTDSGRAFIYLIPYAIARGVGEALSPEAEIHVARSLFMSITLNPEWQKFGGPCPRCSRFFVRKSLKQSVYCSRRCASQRSAIEAIIKRRTKKRTLKLRLAEKTITEFEALRKRRRITKTWKEWVVDRHPEITTWFLTRALNNRELEAPSVKERTRMGKLPRRL